MMSWKDCSSVHNSKTDREKKNTINIWLDMCFASLHSSPHSLHNNRREKRKILFSLSTELKWKIYKIFLIYSNLLLAGIEAFITGVRTDCSICTDCMSPNACMCLMSTVTSHFLHLNVSEEQFATLIVLLGPKIASIFWEFYCKLFLKQKIINFCFQC